MLAPEELGLIQLVLGISFGTVIAELVFGGWGRNVLNPATVTIAFLGFGFPAASWPDLPLPVAWAALAAAAIGAWAGILSARVMAGAALVLWAAQGLGLPVAAVIPAAGIVLVLLVCDPVASAATPLGRWLNGIGYALLVVLFAAGWQGAAPVQIAVSAALFISLGAPLLDEIAIALWLARRRRRLG